MKRNTILNSILTMLLMVLFAFTGQAWGHGSTVRKGAGDKNQALRYGHFNELHYHDVVRIPVDLSDMFVDGTGPITSSSSPNLTTLDNVGKILYDQTTEVAELHFTYMPSVNMTAMSVVVAASCNKADGTTMGIGWSIFVHDDDVAFPTALAQTGAAFTSTTMDVSEGRVTLTLDATGLAAVAAGTSAVTIAIWNNGGVTGDASLEIAKVWIEETGGP